MRVAIYARVSKDDNSQSPDNQLAQLRAWCAAAGHEIVGEFVDFESGGKSARDRAQLTALLDAAHRRQFDMVLFWALDRFSREGMVPTVGYLQQLAASRIVFHSYTEPYLCTDNEMVRDIVLAIVASFAKAERQRIVERTKAGLERVRATGTRLGRPTIDAKVAA